jgi:tripartite-type tricarboxylate transporter receptor subunit TctC
MTMTLRQLSRLATHAVVMAAALLAFPALAQKFPGKPIHMIIPVAPGGGVDLLGRAIGARMADTLGVPVIVENKAGANTVIGTELLAKSPPDGYTIIMASTAHATNGALMKNMPFDPVKDFAPINYVAYIPLVLEVNSSFPAKTYQELISAAKAQPGNLSFGVGAAGAGSHLAGEMLKAQAGIDITPIIYKGNGPALVDLLGAHITMFYDIVTTSLPHIETGKLRPLAVTSAKRSTLLPNVPTMTELVGKPFEVVGWYMLLAPAGTPKDVIATLNNAINLAIKHPDVGGRLSAQGVEFVGGSPADAEAFLKEEVDKWPKFVKAAGIQLK